jgi:hypothetical protein
MKHHAYSNLLLIKYLMPEEQLRNGEQSLSSLRYAYEYSPISPAVHSFARRQNEEKERQAKNLNKFSCPKCKNKDQVNFREVEGSVICLGIDGLGSCGLEIINHRPHEGNFYRNFEGEEDRSHHGKEQHSGVV